MPFFVKNNLPLINLVKFFLFTKLFFILAAIGFSCSNPRDEYKKGKTKNLKHAADDKGFPGKPKKTIFFLNLANIIGLPGLIATPLNWSISLNFFIIFGTKSNFPAEIAPEVITISVLDFKFFEISFSNFKISLSRKIFFSSKVIGNFFKYDF